MMDDNEFMKKGEDAFDESGKENDSEAFSTGDVIIFPDYEILKKDVKNLNEDLLALLLERDELEFVICRNIETQYYLKLGSIEYKVYESLCTVLRLKRKIELIQANKNRQEKVVIRNIEEKLDSEFADYQKKLDEKINKMNDAIKYSKSKVLSKEETAELKKIYRNIVKTFHPDINPDVSPEKKELFNNAVRAYKNGDLATLRVINEMTGGFPLPKQPKDAMTQLADEKRRLKKLIDYIKESIENIKSKFPYTVKDFVNDDRKVQQKKQELENILKQYSDLISFYNAKIDEMLR